MKVAIIDTETTGVAAHDEPISIGILLVEIELGSGVLVREIGRYHGLREPRVPIHPKAQAVHGMTAADLSGKVLDLCITSLINEADVLIAHNAQFDARMLAVVCDAASAKSWRCSFQQFPWPAAVGRKKLDSVCEFYGVIKQPRHDALGDCEALLAVLLIHTGKTTRSRTYLALLLAKTSVIFDAAPRAAMHRSPAYQQPPADWTLEPRQPVSQAWNQHPVEFKRPQRRRQSLSAAEITVWAAVLLIAMFVGLAAHG
ncbi:exonuclease domain-containing protein [Burkholderia sp. BCC1998]|uniref:exonuclease domain-containing protein n=1 Tax=Burkholderia sp. BCC1998 TaxID=2817447 RepID=UPI002AB7A177|nr:exonuclease domain-containing protein [Burkholderia sp. BCC1998]